MGRKYKSFARMQLANVTYGDVKTYMWHQGDLSYKLWDQQKPIHETVKNLPLNSNTIVMLCARQFGKSVLGCLLAIEDCLNNDNVSVMIVAPEIKHCRSIVNPRMKMLTADAPLTMVSFTKSEDRWAIGTSEIILGGFDVQNAGRIRGKTLHKIYIEELVDSDPDSYMDSLRSDLAPALTHSKNPQMIYLTTLPKIPDHPFITQTIPDSQLDGAFFKFTIKDNKKLSEAQYRTCVRLCGGEDSVEFLREYMCEFVRDQSITVIPYFSEHHVKNFVLPLETRYFIAIDFGGVRDKTVALLLTYDFFNNKHLIVDERVFKANTPTDEIVDELWRLESGFTIEQRVSDSSGQHLIDLNETHEYQVIMPNKTDWKASVNQMSVLFSLNQILIHPRCQFLIQSCRSGTFNKQRTDFERTAALGHCDALAALMYGIRAVNLESPYTTNNNYSENFWTPPQPEEPSLALKSFGVRKKFGAFR
jgi:hypothetical protein